MLKLRSEDLGHITYSSTLGFHLCSVISVDRFSVDLDIGWKKRNEWLIYIGDRKFTSFDATEIHGPNLSMNFFIFQGTIRLNNNFA